MDTIDTAKLCAQLKRIKEEIGWEATRQLLGHLATTEEKDAQPTILRELLTTSGRNQVILVSADGWGQNRSRTPTRVAEQPTGKDLWSALEAGGNERGRLVRIHSLSPTVVLVLTSCLRSFFDIQGLFSRFLSRTWQYDYHNFLTITANMHCYLPFSINYYYLDDDGRHVYQNQKSGRFHEDLDGTFIYKGSSSIVLSLLSGLDILTAPWRLLVLTCNRKTDRTRSMDPPGPGMEAFLWAIHIEVRGARISLEEVSERAASLAVSSDDFFFDGTLQEKFPFENEAYTNTRTCFWALNYLRVMNDCAKNTISHWRNYKKILLEQPLSRIKQLESVLAVRFKLIDEELEKLEDLIMINNSRQEDIRSLRDGIFNASTVYEARTSIAQGKNIQMLTYISLVFLPATFVTSIFSMGSVLPQTIDIKSFAVTFSVICGVTYAAIAVIVNNGVSRVARKIPRRSQGSMETDAQPPEAEPAKRSKRKEKQTAELV